jgi:hypothetical protein
MSQVIGYQNCKKSHASDPGVITWSSSTTYATELKKSKVSDPLANSGHAAFSVTSKTSLIVGELSLRNLNKQNTVQ